jgi:phage terminase large subunit-like protein
MTVIGQSPTARLAEAVSPLSPASRALLAARVDANVKHMAEHRRFELTYPDTGPLRRELYEKHTTFFAAGAEQMERALIGANRSGKSTSAAYEVTAHLTGRYPPWWRGRRFNRPVVCWAAGVDAKSVRETIQIGLFGEEGKVGTGMIPADAIVSTTRRSGVSGAFDTALIRHVGGGTSRIVFKAYDQGRESFQGSKIDVGWADEEPPADVYSEFLTRLMSTVPGEESGVLLATFTPLLGLSQVVQGFLPGGQPDAEAELTTKWSIIVGWEDAPHLSQRDKDNLAASYLPHEKDARMKGIPSLGAGAIYPVAESSIVCEPFEVPAWYRRCFALDVGWQRTAAVWGALDYETDVLYLVSEHYMAHAEPAVHAQGIRARGDWIPGVIDPAARGRALKDGEQLLKIYQDLLRPMTLEPANNAVEAGLYAVWERLSSGRLRVFSTLQNWLGEFRVYRRDPTGKIVKERDHLMDATRYLVLSGLSRAAAKPSRLWQDRDLPAGAREQSGFTSEYDPAPYGISDQRRPTEYEERLRWR